MKLSAARLPALAAAFALAACGSGSTPPGADAGTGNDAGTTGDAGTTSDAGTPSDAGTTSDAGPPSDAGTGSDAGTPSDAGPTGDGGCTASAAYGAVTPTGQTASYTPGDEDGGADDSYQYQGNLNADIDYVDVELYAGDGAFANGIAIGNYTIAGDDLNYSTCGLCVVIFTNFNGTDYVDSYLATGGSVTIASLYPTLSGTLSNLTFQHVTIDDDNNFVSTPVNDGCGSTLTSLSFSADDSSGSRNVHRKHR